MISNMKNSLFFIEYLAVLQLYQCLIKSLMAEWSECQLTAYSSQLTLFSSVSLTIHLSLPWFDPALADLRVKKFVSSLPVS